MKKTPILTISNHHVADCGPPPNLSMEGMKTLYFENRFGEQFIIQHDLETNVCKLWAGDLGWDKEYRVREFGNARLVIPAFKEERNADPDVLAEMYQGYREQFGELTDDECDGLCRAMIISKEEFAVIDAFWTLCQTPRNGLLY